MPAGNPGHSIVTIKTDPGCRVALTANTDWALYNFRKGLIDSLVRSGWRVFGVCKVDQFRTQVASIRSVRIFHLRRYVKSVAPLRDILLTIEMVRCYKRIRPCVAHHFTIKPVIFGTLAARAARVPVVVNTITGLGYVFTDREEESPFLKHVVLCLYRLMGILSDLVIVQNLDDQAFFLGNRIVPRRKLVLIPGSGVDTDLFSRRMADREVAASLTEELGLSTGQKLILCVSRMLYDKGIAEFVDSAADLRRTSRDLRFVLVGPLAPGNPAMIHPQTIERWVAEGTVQYLGRRDQIRELFYLADVVVLPSYREGTSRVLLEAASMEKAVVTTDVPGCRDFIEHGVNGVLVPPRDASALARAIRSLVDDPKLAEGLAREARKRVAGRYDDRTIAGQTEALYRRLLANGSKDGFSAA